MEANYKIYKHTSPSGKCYIGITCQTPENRYGTNGCKYTEIKKDGHFKHPIFAKAILKYGWDNIKHEILFSNLTEERAKNLEISLIRHYKNLGLSYNVTDGGEGTSGLKMSEETKKKLIASKLGKKQSKETIAKRVIKNTGKIRTPEQKAKRSKPVEQYDLHGNLIASYFGVREAGRQTSINSSHIVDCCNRKPNRNTAGGFVWKWKIA